MKTRTTKHDDYTTEKASVRFPNGTTAEVIEFTHTNGGNLDFATTLIAPCEEATPGASFHWRGQTREFVSLAVDDHASVFLTPKQAEGVITALVAAFRNDPVDTDEDEVTA